MAKVTTKEQLAADLARRGGPNRPTNEQRAAASRRVQANPGKPLLYDDEQMRKLSAGRTGANNRRGATVNPPPMNAPDRPIAFPSGPGPQPPMGPRLNPSSPPAYQPPPYRPLTPTTAPGGLPGGAMPQPSAPMRPPMPSAPASRPQSMQAMTQLIDILAKLSAWGGDEMRPTTNPQTWLPDLWSLSNR